MKKLLFVLFAVVIAISSFAVCVSAAESEMVDTDLSETVSETSEIVSETSKEASEETSEPSNALDTEVELEYYGFGNEGFSRNLSYMGLGMLGIFAVVGVVILITFILNNVTSKK